ncbi:hypothetical protein J6590_045912 [Homalodisca vitripennis]|nr:hypothetical protein J6590_045912 [Homalodisca vitripennis]
MQGQRSGESGVVRLGSFPTLFMTAGLSSPHNRKPVSIILPLRYYNMCVLLRTSRMIYSAAYRRLGTRGFTAEAATSN